MAIATDMGQMFCIAQENGFKLPPLPLGLRAPSSLGAGEEKEVPYEQRIMIMKMALSVTGRHTYWLGMRW